MAPWRPPRSRDAPTSTLTNKHSCPSDPLGLREARTPRAPPCSSSQCSDNLGWRDTEIFHSSQDVRCLGARPCQPGQHLATQPPPPRKSGRSPPSGEYRREKRLPVHPWTANHWSDAGGSRLPRPNPQGSPTCRFKRVTPKVGHPAQGHRRPPNGAAHPRSGEVVSATEKAVIDQEGKKSLNLVMSPAQLRSFLLPPAVRAQHGHATAAPPGWLG